MGKRLVDLVIGSLALAVLFPALVGVAVLVRLHLGRPILFRQRRPGRSGSPFQLLKFRTMTEERDSSGTLLPDRIRLTPLGRLMRRSSLDELPELWNVIRGDMSLVGPRPLLFRYRAYYSEREQLRERVRPGLTGWAQVNGRNLLAWEDRLEMDAWYVEHATFSLDLRIFWQTIRIALSRRGVVEDPQSVMPDLDVERRRIVGHVDAGDCGGAGGGDHGL